MRSWLRTPRLALTLLACIAVSIGGTATVLTFVHAILIRPLPFPHAERLVSLVPQIRGPGDRDCLAYPNFDDLRRSASSFEVLAGAVVSRLVLQTPGGSERRRARSRLAVHQITPGSFSFPLPP